MRYRPAVFVPAAPAIGIALLLFACTAQPPVDMEAETAALREAVMAYDEAGSTANAEALVALYAADGVMLPPNGPDVVGHDNIRGFLESFTTLENFQYQASAPTVVVSADGSMGYSVAALTLSWQADGEVVSEDFRDVHIWSKDPDGEWKLAVDIWNSTEPAD